MNEILDTEIYFHTFHKKSQTWLHCLSSHPFIPTDQGCRLSRGPCSGGVGEAEGGRCGNTGQVSMSHIQLFRERLSKKVYATILKGIVAGFLFTVFQRNFKEYLHERPWTYVFEG